MALESIPIVHGCKLKNPKDTESCHKSAPKVDVVKVDFDEESKRH